MDPEAGAPPEVVDTELDKLNIVASKGKLESLVKQYRTILGRADVYRGNISAYPEDQKKLDLISQFFEAIGQPEMVNEVNKEKRAKPMNEQKAGDRWPKIRT